MKIKEKERAERCLKYFGDIFAINTKVAMDKKFKEINKRIKTIERNIKNENKRIEKETAQLLRENEKQLAKYYQPKH